jgi:hypothetical protein
MSIIDRINSAKDWATIDSFKRKDFIEYLAARNFTCDPLTGKYCRNMVLGDLRYWVLDFLREDRELAAATQK